jgi:hypothetical protein
MDMSAIDEGQEQIDQAGSITVRDVSALDPVLDQRNQKVTLWFQKITLPVGDWVVVSGVADGPQLKECDQFISPCGVELDRAVEQGIQLIDRMSVLGHSMRNVLPDILLEVVQHTEADRAQVWKIVVEGGSLHAQCVRHRTHGHAVHAAELNGLKGFVRDFRSSF